MHEFDRARLDQRFNEGKFEFFRPFMEQWGLWDADHLTLLKASSYRGVLDGILYFMTEDGYDQKAVRQYARGFVRTHPELKTLSRSSALSPRQRLIFSLFAAGCFRLMTAYIRLRRKKARQ